LVEALRRLPMELQIALELRYWERLTNVQIAEITEVPEGTVKSRINRAKRLLRTIISQLEAPPQIVRDTVERLDEWVEQVRERLLRDSEKRASSAGEDEPEGNDPSRS
jgi:RNA polymerase sigma-70 factor (ECF subfamily)